MSQVLYNNLMGNIAVIGAGYVGLTTAIGIAELGYNVTCVDINQDKVDKLNAGIPHILEPGLSDSLNQQLKSGNFVASTSYQQALSGAKVVFVCVDTPQSEDGKANLSSINRAFDTILNLVVEPMTVVIKSTVPPGTAKGLEERTPANLRIVSNPEFLREGSALHDFHNPDRIVLGASDPSSYHIVSELYSSLKAETVYTDLNSAELIKYASNAMLASRISFVNEIAQVCMAFSGDIKDVMSAVSLDPRIGSSFLSPGPGWGGSCFPKDVSALQALVKGVGLRVPLIESINVSNSSTQLFVSKLLAELVALSQTRVVGVWGLTFKAGTDDLRDSPSIEIIKRLVELGFEVLAYDPTVEGKFFGMPDGVRIFSSAEAVLEECSTLAVLTEWEEFKNFRPSKDQVNGLRVFDTRLILDSDVWTESGAAVTKFGLGVSTA